MLGTAAGRAGRDIDPEYPPQAQRLRLIAAWPALEWHAGIPEAEESITRIAAFIDAFMASRQKGSGILSYWVLFAWRMRIVDELRRRNVLRVAIAYIALCWLIMQLAMRAG